METNRRIKDLKLFNKKLIYDNEATRVIERNREDIINSQFSTKDVQSNLDYYNKNLILKREINHMGSLNKILQNQLFYVNKKHRLLTERLARRA